MVKRSMAKHIRQYVVARAERDRYDYQAAIRAPWADAAIIEEAFEERLDPDLADIRHQYIAGAGEEPPDDLGDYWDEARKLYFDLLEKDRRPEHKARKNPNEAYWGDDLVLRKGRITNCDNGCDIAVQPIGKGKFSKAYLVLDRDPGRLPRGRAAAGVMAEPLVVIVSREDTYDKDILSKAHADNPNNPHIPAVVKRGMLRGAGQVFTVPWYEVPLRKGNSAQAWRDYTAIKKCLETGWKAVRAKSTTYYEEHDPGLPGLVGPRMVRRARTTSTAHEGYNVAYATWECATANKAISRPLVNALESIMQVMSNYGSSYIFEFAPRNLGTDSKGRLVLVDPMFDMAKVWR